MNADPDLVWISVVFLVHAQDFSSIALNQAKSPVKNIVRLVIMTSLTTHLLVRRATASLLVVTFTINVTTTTILSPITIVILLYLLRVIE